MKTKKRFTKVLIACVAVAVIIAAASVFSYASFGVVNPIACGIGLFKVTLTDTTYAEVQNDPKVIFFKENYGIQAMEEHGYTFLKNEQMGAMVSFEKDGVKYRGIWDSGRISFFRGE